jgi:hypothetical protein
MCLNFMQIHEYIFIETALEQYISVLYTYSMFSTITLQTAQLYDFVRIGESIKMCEAERNENLFSLYQVPCYIVEIHSIVN